MAGFKRQIFCACVKLGINGEPFDWKDVRSKLPQGPYAPTDRQIIAELSNAKYLEIESGPDRWGNASTRYKLGGTYVKRGVRRKHR